MKKNILFITLISALLFSCARTDFDELLRMQAEQKGQLTDIDNRVKVLEEMSRNANTEININLTAIIS